VNGWIVLGIVAGIVVLGILAQRFGVIDLRDKSRSGGSGMSGAFGSLDEVFAPTRHEAQQEMDRQTILPAPAPLPGDGDKGIAVGTSVPGNPLESDKYRGSVRINLPRK
jgi:hypothetical protein